MNVYEQLQGVKSDLQERGARPESIRVIDTMIARAQDHRDSGLSMSRLQVLRQVMKMPDVLNNEDVRLDFLGLEGDLEEEAAQRAQPAAAAYEEVDRRPKLKKYYKKK